MSWSIAQKDWFAIFRVKVAVRAHVNNEKMTVCTMLSELLILSCAQTSFDGTVS